MRRDERRDRGLVRQVEAVERLVEQQQLRPADERLRDQQPLLLAAGELADRRARRTRSAPTSSITCVHALAGARRLREAGQREPPAGAVEAEPDEVDAADPGSSVEAAAAAAGSRSRAFASPGGRPSTVAVPARERQQPEQRP